ncbi:MAG: hypothetical protein ACTSXW_06835 [Candidatus Baldrarchaeia archaeon]
MSRKTVALSLDEEIYEKYKKYCKENSIILSRRVESFMKEDCLTEIDDIIKKVKVSPIPPNDLSDLLKKLVKLPAAGVNLDLEDITSILRNSKKINIIKKEFYELDSFIVYIKNINPKILKKSVGAIFLVLVDPNRFPDLHYISYSPIFNGLNKKIEKNGIAFTMAFYRTVYEKNRIVTYFLMGY